MSKTVFIAEKPSVAREFAGALDQKFQSRDGYMESENTIVTWCVGHLVTMCYPDAYDPALKKWSLSTIPFIPSEFRYQVIDSVKKQFKIVERILTSADVDTIYICTDSGREGEYIYRLVAQQAGVKNKRQLRVWIDSQTREEILRGIKNAKDDSDYDNLGDSAYLRAKEDYLMGINFSRALTLKYGDGISRFLGTKYSVVAVGRVMTCVLGMVVGREREIRSFVKTPFYRVVGNFGVPSTSPSGEESVHILRAEWKSEEGSIYYLSPKLYKENGFREKKDAEELIRYLTEKGLPETGARVESVTHKKETKNPPLLYNLAELQNDCSRYFHISPDQTLSAAQELYEKKLTTYPRTDARVLSSAVAKEIHKNLGGIGDHPMFKGYTDHIFETGAHKKIVKSRYTNDKAITDHYAIIPTGQGLRSIQSLSETTRKIYELICRRFISIFYPPAIFDKITVRIRIGTEVLTASERTCKEKGYLKVTEETSFLQKKSAASKANDGQEGGENDDAVQDAGAFAALRKGKLLTADGFEIKEGETKPPKRYNSGSMILAMENAGQLIEEEELREQIRGSGIGTSATRAEILKKLVSNKYLALNSKTQIVTPTLLGEMIYDTVYCSIRPLLDPKLTASWELGLSRVADGSVSEEDYTEKLNSFIVRRTEYVKNTNYTAALQQQYEKCAAFYPARTETGKPSRSNKSSASGARKGGAKKKQKA